MAKQPQKPSFLERLATRLDLPGDIMAGLPRIEIVGCRQLYLSNHKGLLAYENDFIAVNGGKVVVKIRGDGLIIRAMQVDDLMLEGTIFGIEFEY